LAHSRPLQECLQITDSSQANSSGPLNPVGRLRRRIIFRPTEPLLPIGSLRPFRCADYRRSTFVERHPWKQGLPCRRQLTRLAFSKRFHSIRFHSPKQLCDC
jgi:hypothetical protein